MKTVDKVRVDKWLWAVRIFKSRSLASDACKAGRVKIGGKSVKASYLLKVDETVSVQKSGEKKVLKALQLIEKRVGAKIAVDCYEDLSPAPEKRDDLQRSIFWNTTVQREKGSGRPTKRERRDLDKFFDD